MPKLRDEEMAAMAARHESIKQEIALLERERKELQEKMLKEMHRRGAVSETLTEGWKLTRRHNTYTNFDPLALRRRLRNKPEVLARIFVEKLDPAAVKAEVDAKNISLKTVNASAIITESDEWVVVTPVKGS